MDVTSRRTCSARRARAARAFGRLDIMICNAGFGYYGTVEDTPPETMRRMMDVNFMGTFLGARAALPIFRAQGRGHLIFVSSIVGRRGIALMSGYSATKAAQAGFAESLRTEFAGTADPRQRRLSRLDGRRSSATRWSATTATRSPGSDRSSRSTTSRDAIVRCIERPRPRCIPHGTSRAPRRPQRRRARLHRSARAAVRTAQERAGTRERQRHVTLSKQVSVTNEPTTAGPAPTPPIAGAMARAIADAGGRALIVGGWVRDQLLGHPSKDVDLEVFGLDARRAARCPRGASAASTPSARASPSTRSAASTSRCRDASRRSGRGHKGFVVQGDPVDVVRGGGAPARLHDQRDLVGPADRRVHRSVRRPPDLAPGACCASSTRARSATTACACCGRCSSRRASSSTWSRRRANCAGASPLDDLPAERIWGEFEKLLLHAARPSIGLRARARPRRRRPALPGAQGTRRLPAGAGVASRGRRLGPHADGDRPGAHADRRPAASRGRSR